MIRARRAKAVEMNRKKLYFIETNAGSMIASVDSDNNCRYMWENNECEFPHIWEMPEEDRKKAATKFLRTVEDDSSWNDNLTYDELFNDDTMASYNNPDGLVIIAEIEKEL